jgi:GH15 family glucan-1,4-alpha-glucosidase
VLTWFASHKEQPRPIDHEHALRDTTAYWKDWSEKCEEQGEWQEPIVRSLITLKGLTYAPTGGIVAALTTSLPEEIGGVRNWDYRFCWLRDATFTLYALLTSGYLDESRSWRQWLLRAIAGSASQMQIMYGVHGERRLDEWEVPWLAGYENSKPVRIGNAASNQFQLDVYGEILAAMYAAHRAGLETSETEWHLQIELIQFLETKWMEPDEGIWEVRGGQQQFTHSKMMAWVAFDRAVKMSEECNCAADQHVGRWREIRDEIHRQVCARGYNTKKKAFTQVYDSDQLDASLLMMPLIGFLPIDDERVRNTIEAIERELMWDGFVLRYRVETNDVDGLPGGEGVFLPCSFWFAACLHLMGRTDEARELFERLLGLRNDLGLYSEEYHPGEKRQLGNFPQAFTHVALINAAQLLSGRRQVPKSHPPAPDA